MVFRYAQIWEWLSCHISSGEKCRFRKATNRTQAHSGRASQATRADCQKAERDEEAEFRAAAKTGGLAALHRIMALAVGSDSEELRFRADMFLVGYGYSKPPQLQDTTVNANINNRYACSFEISDLALKGSYIEAQAIEHEDAD
jgi:hypothetical protein